MLKTRSLGAHRPEKTLSQIDEIATVCINSQTHFQIVPQRLLDSITNLFEDLWIQPFKMVLMVYRQWTWTVM
jgi:hypothetical protein